MHLSEKAITKYRLKRYRETDRPTLIISLRSIPIEWYITHGRWRVAQRNNKNTIPLRDRGIKLNATYEKLPL